MVLHAEQDKPTTASKEIRKFSANQQQILYHPPSLLCSSLFFFNNETHSRRKFLIDLVGSSVFKITHTHSFQFEREQFSNDLI